MLEEMELSFATEAKAAIQLQQFPALLAAE